MGEFPIFLTAAAVVAFILLAPRLRSALRGGLRGSLGDGIRRGFQGGVLGGLKRTFRGGKPRRRHIDVEADLLSACGGDRATMERLIRHELDRKPELERTGAALMALSRLRADRR